jgi:tol-pal system protein YbgF
MSMQRNVCALGITLLCSVLLSACATPREQDPTWQKLTEVDGRVLRIERVINNQSLLELAQKNDALQTDVRNLRGQLEELQHSVDMLRDQQRDLFADLDRRVQGLESNRAAAQSAVAAAQVNDRDAYQTAFNLLKDSKYTEAADAFTKFLSSYPQSGLLDNAQYWLGEAHYVLKDYPQAQRDFQAVQNNYPNSAKLPDALLKLGYTYYELKNYKDARATLKQVADQYAETTSGKLAQQRLAKLTAEGH